MLQGVASGAIVQMIEAISILDDDGDDDAWRTLVSLACKRMCIAVSKDLQNKWDPAHKEKSLRDAQGSCREKTRSFETHLVIRVSSVAAIGRPLSPFTHLSITRVLRRSRPVPSTNPDCLDRGATISQHCWDRCVGTQVKPSCLSTPSEPFRPISLLCMGHPCCRVQFAPAHWKLDTQ